MLNNELSVRDYKDAAYGAFSLVSRAMGSARRLEVIDQLVQGPRTVEDLASRVAQPVPNVSQHLQVLKRAGLVEPRRQGTHVEYRLQPGVAEVFVALRELATRSSPALRELQKDFYEEQGVSDTMSADDLLAGVADGSVVLLDVRPPEEYAHGHLPGARCAPFSQLEELIDELPKDRTIVATCRGPYCVFAADAVKLLRARGFTALRFEDGVGEWQAQGRSLEMS